MNYHRIYTWTSEKFMSSLPLPFGKVRPMLFLSGRTILCADPDLKIGPKLKIVNDIVTSIIGKQGKTRLACMNFTERNLQQKATNRG